MAKRPESIWHAIKGRCLFLLTSLLVLMLTYPIVQHGAQETLMMMVLNSVTLIAGIYAVSNNRSHIVIGISLAIPQIATTLVAYLLPLGHPNQHLFENTSNILLVVFYVFTLSLVAAYVIRPGDVTRDKIYGAISIYLLSGLSWASIFGLIDGIDPGSFICTSGGGVDFIYYSFSTLTTLGYGDILPITPKARALASLEAVSGVTYMAIAIARLVSLYRPDPAAQPDLR